MHALKPELCFLECKPFGLVLDALQDGVTVYDRDGNLIWINAKACQILGASRAELLGSNVSAIASSPQVQAFVTPELVNATRRAGRCGYSTRIEDYTSAGYMTFTNGKQMLYTGTFVPDERGALLYAIYTIRDVTDLQEARKKVDDLRKLTSLYQAELNTLHTQVLGQALIYRSERMRKVVEQALRVAALEGNVLLTGETGVGKTLLARYLHVMSRRSAGPFIHINCASLPESLIEAELFGYSEGAFTDASRKGRKGLLELGQGGTVLLDEIGDMPLNMQAKLLTVLEDKALRRIGSEKWNPLDVRFVAATNRSVEALVEGKALRQDIYYRLAMSQIDIPPLRERPDDIPCLVDRALAQFNDKNQTNVSMRADVVGRLSRLPWQGNVRELNNVVWRIASESAECEVTWAQLSRDLVETLARLGKTPDAVSVDATAGRDAVEEERLRALCQQCGGDVYAIANILNLHRTTVIRKLRHHGIAYARKKVRRSYGRRCELIT